MTTQPRKSCAPSADGRADDTIARIFGCPDCPGMKNLSPPMLTFCYQMKRPMGKIVFFGIGGILLYLMMGRK
jgi:hypothetical protein